LQDKELTGGQRGLIDPVTEWPIDYSILARSRDLVCRHTGKTVMAEIRLLYFPMTTGIGLEPDCYTTRFGAMSVAKTELKSGP